MKEGHGYTYRLQKIAVLKCLQYQEEFDVCSGF